MPVDVLPELIAYRDLVLTVAKELYRQRHQDKARLPKGFSDRFNLEIREVKPGSAMPILERIFPTAVADGTRDEFDEARDLISATVESVSIGNGLPEEFPRKAVSAFNSLGRRLRPDEYVALVSPDSDSGPRFDKEVRGNILLAAFSSYTDEVSVIGEVDSVDIGRHSFTIKIEETHRLNVPYELSREEFDLIGSVYPASAPVAVKGTGLFDSKKRLSRFEEVSEVSLLEETSGLEVFNLSINQLTTLPEDWFEGSPKFDEGDFRWIRTFFYDLALNHGIPLPVVFPVSPRLVRAEWRPLPIDVSAEIDLGSKDVYIHAFNVSTDEAVERESNANHQLDEIVSFLEGYLPQEV